MQTSRIPTPRPKEFREAVDKFRGPHVTIADAILALYYNYTASPDGTRALVTRLARKLAVETEPAGSGRDGESYGERLVFSDGTWVYTRGSYAYMPFFNSDLVDRYLGNH